MDRRLALSHGLTREVLLVGRWAVKVPTLRHGWRQAVLGALANVNERDLSAAAHGDPGLAAVVWASPMALVVVQERVAPVRGVMSAEDRMALPLRDFCGMPGADSHGIGRRDDGTLVCFDYGAPGLMLA